MTKAVMLTIWLFKIGYPSLKVICRMSYLAN